MLISVCINTYKRPMVLESLRSVAAQDLPLGAQVELIVADNDEAGSGREYIEQFSTQTNVPVNYRVVPERNIAIARNDCIARANGDWLAFIDDDEIASPNWLLEMLTTAKRCKSDAVMGKVQARYPSTSPEWLTRADPLSKCWGPPETLIRGGSTCNALVSTAALKRLSFFFDKEWGRAGADDSELFNRLCQSGAKIHMSAATVTEIIFEDRTKPKYLRLRFRRIGETHAAIHTKDKSRAEFLAYYFTAFRNTLKFGLLALLTGFWHKEKWCRYKVKYWQSSGRLRKLIGKKRIEMY